MININKKTLKVTKGDVSRCLYLIFKYLAS